MCGFFAFSTGMSSRQLADLFQLTNLPGSLEDIESLKYFPKSLIPTVSKNSPNQLIMRYWSLIPRWWTKDLTELKFSTFNARSEDITQKASYKAPWTNSQRCLIPATWFYEFQARQTNQNSKKVTKIPHRVEVEDQPIFTMAGLYETWTDPQGNVMETVAIITAEASDALRPIHPRQPVIISPEDRGMWLDKETTPQEAMQLMRATEELKIAEIDQEFNRAFGDEVTPDLVAPAKNSAQSGLFN